jgi:methylenetetrahydrofolate--tRNA-(uracil-5-)-methyltransferase
MNRNRIHIVGAGLAGSEAAYQLARRGHSVVIHEMRPTRLTEAHQTGLCAELVCSNSLKTKNPISAPGMLKAEMNHLGSLILECAGETSVPGGEALTVDRDLFSARITERLKENPKISWEPGVVTEPFSDGITLLATGPLTSPELSQWLARASGEKDLYFYDAIAPIIDANSIDLESAFLANRYDKGGEEAYLNCPLTREEYYAFVEALMMGEKVKPKIFEEEKFFQGCQPIEAIAATGRETLRFGPMKPVGLRDPRKGDQPPELRPYAMVQLRPENRSRTAFNMVGFQTKLKYGEQSKIFKMIPALRNAEFLRLGSIHRNTYVCGPRVLRPDLSLKGHPSVYLAGQITGVEGYLESAACGQMASLFIDQRIRGTHHRSPPVNTALGALLAYIVGSDPAHYQPVNAHFGLFDPQFFEAPIQKGKDELRKSMAEQALQNWVRWSERQEIVAQT